MRERFRWINILVSSSAVRIGSDCIPVIELVEAAWAEAKPDSPLTLTVVPRWIDNPKGEREPSFSQRRNLPTVVSYLYSVSVNFAQLCTEGL